MNQSDLAAACVAVSARQPALDLWREYAAWQLCRRVLARVTDALAPLGVSAQQTAVLLENALMFMLLSPPSTRPVELLRAVDDAALARGIDCVQPLEAGAGDVAETVRAAVARALDESEGVLWHLEWPVVRLGEDAMLHVGDFRLAWSRPVQRALDRLLAQMPTEAALERLLRAALRYDAIFADTRHIGPPQPVYDAFHRWGVRNEGFASPFNARLLGRPGSRFFSAFADTDGVFGSQGSFFACEPAQYAGAWCLDPPFLPDTMRMTDQRIAAMRGRGEAAPAILLIVPASHTPALAPDETVLLEQGVHVVEGLADSFFTLPVDVTIHRYGELPGFDAAVIRDGYSDPSA